MTYENDIPDYALIPAKEPEERVRLPIARGAVYSPVQVTNIGEKPRTVITIEEDILVPDTKPDLREILLVDGKAFLSSREADRPAKGGDCVNVSGEIELQTLYLPEKREGAGPVIAVQTRLPFKDQWHTAPEDESTLLLDCCVEKIEYMVINERKFRVKVFLAVFGRECTDRKVDIFEGLADEEIQVLKEKVEITSIALRKKDVLPLKEDVAPADDPRPETILKQDLCVIENYKQCTGDKVVINGFVYANVLYTAYSQPAPFTDTLPAARPAGAPAPAGPQAGRDLPGAAGGVGGPDADNRPEESQVQEPSLYQLQTKTEFTQFIPVQQDSSWSGCRVAFDDRDLRIKLTQNEDGEDVFRLEGDLLTYVELYKNEEKEVIVDGYHKEKNFVCDFEREDCKALIGTVAGEATVRELISPEDSMRDIDRILYYNAQIVGSESHSEQNRTATEGILLAKAVCLAADDEKTVFSVKKEIPFRVVNAMPQLTGEEIVYHSVYLKDMWAEKINGKQLEFNATVLVCGEVMKPSPFVVLKNPAFEEPSDEEEPVSMAVYVCRDGDTLWHIAKRFKTSMDSIRQTNELESDDLAPGRKLLVVK